MKLLIASLICLTSFTASAKVYQQQATANFAANAVKVQPSGIIRYACFDGRRYSYQGSNTHVAQYTPTNTPCERFDMRIDAKQAGR
jgi:hypothetical protein